jgi:hypothetical protein
MNENELIENINQICNHPNVKSVEVTENPHEIKVYFYEIDTELAHELRNKIDEFLNTQNLEVSGVGTNFSNYEEYKRTLDEWKKTNPEPQNPMYDPRGGYSREWKRRSYYDRTKGKGAREMAAFKDAHLEWTQKVQKAIEDGIIAPRFLGGFSCGIATLGYTAKMLAEYESLRYKGD